MEAVLNALVRGAIGGFVFGFLLLWLWPSLYEGAGWSPAILWHSGLAVQWAPVLMTTAISAIGWAWATFLRETETGRTIAFVSFLGRCLISLFR